MFIKEILILFYYGRADKGLKIPRKVLKGKGGQTVEE